jgi:hypothetical protein
VVWQTRHAPLLMEENMTEADNNAIAETFFA